MVVKLSKVNDKEKIPKMVRENCQVTCEGKPTRLPFDISGNPTEQKIVG